MNDDYEEALDLTLIHDELETLMRSYCDCGDLMCVVLTTEAALGVGTDGVNIYKWNVCGSCRKVELRNV